ncbi:MAG TPA: transposase [Methylocystis sp.]|nr:transposase [Methylocystis sp.]
MLSLILLCHAPAENTEAFAALTRERAARSLASLVEASIAGVIADATLVAAPAVFLADIADEAGCHMIEVRDAAAAVAQALAQARQTDVFLLHAGFCVDRGFVDEAADAAAFGGLKTARALKAAPEGLLTRLAPSLARPVGLLARKNAISEAGGAEVARLARLLRAREMVSRARRGA